MKIYHSYNKYIVESYIFILIPAPIVELIEIFLIKVPFAPEGRAFCTASMNELIFSVIFSDPKLTLPTPA
jgi:hypothetical protein